MADDLSTKLNQLRDLKNQNQQTAQALDTLINEYVSEQTKIAQSQAQAVHRQQVLHAQEQLNADAIKQFKRTTVYPNDIYNTFQFMNGSLARDVFNRDGNVINGEYKFLARRVAGLDTQGKNAYQPGAMNSPNTGNANPNGSAPANSTGVGWTPMGADKLLTQKYWAWWVLQKATITKLASLVRWETPNPVLSEALYRCYTIAILSGHSALEILPNNQFKVWEAINLQYDGDAVSSYEVMSPGWFFHGNLKDTPKDSDTGKRVNAKDPNFILMTWDLEGYNVWFYTVFYTLDFIDLQYEWLSRAFFERAILFQLQSSDNQNAKNEVNQLMNPDVRVIQIQTARVVDPDNLIQQNDGHIVIGNRYAYTELGSIQDSQIFETFPKLWLNLWDSIIGITPQNAKFDASRSITDEIAPQIDLNKIIQQKYKYPVNCFIRELEEKTGLTVTPIWATDEMTPNVGWKEEGNDPNADTPTDDPERP